MARDQVFISYAREDAALMEEFRTMLEPLVSSGVTTAWTDTDIPAGAKWEDEINRALAKARIGVLLVTSDFLASDFIMKTEVPALEAAATTGELTLIWIAARPCLYEASPLSKYQAANDPEKPLSGLSKNDRQSELAEVCRQIQVAIQASSALPKIARTSGAPTRACATVSIPDLRMQERLELVKGLSAITPGQFNQMLFVVNPPPGIIPSIQAAQGERAAALLQWTEGPGGCGLALMKAVYDQIINLN